MKRYLSAISVVLAGAVGAVIALLVVGTGSSKTVTTVLASSGTGSNVPTSYTKAGSLDVNSIYKKDINGVVDITVTSVTQGSSNGFYSTPSQESEGEGAGVVYDDQGDIITDEHVVANATSVKVHFEDGTTASAKVLGSDPSTDVAVIKVNVPSSELHPIAFANSSTAQVGDQVVAIGSPFGLPGTVTQGIISAVNRSIEAPNGWTISQAIQTDASINPGNSGGPLLDAAGEVIGLNDQIETGSSESDQSSGVGFATPGNTDVQVADKIIAGKTVQHAWLGVALVSSNISGGAQIETGSGAITAGSPAAKAGLKAGDAITKLNGTSIADADAFISDLGSYNPGQTVTLTVKRGDKTLQIKVTLGNRPKSAPTAG